MVRSLMYLTYHKKTKKAKKSCKNILLLSQFFLWMCNYNHRRTGISSIYEKIGAYIDIPQPFATCTFIF